MSPGGSNPSPSAQVRGGFRRSFFFEDFCRSRAKLWRGRNSRASAGSYRHAAMADRHHRLTQNRRHLRKHHPRRHGLETLGARGDGGDGDRPVEAACRRVAPRAGHDRRAVVAALARACDDAMDPASRCGRRSAGDAWAACGWGGDAWNPRSTSSSRATGTRKVRPKRTTGRPLTPRVAR